MKVYVIGKPDLSDLILALQTGAVYETEKEAGEMLSDYPPEEQVQVLEIEVTLVPR